MFKRVSIKPELLWIMEGRGGKEWSGAQPERRSLDRACADGCYAPYWPPRIAGCGLPTWPASFRIAGTSGSDT
jgi:hypothetical protein